MSSQVVKRIIRKLIAPSPRGSEPSIVEVRKDVSNEALLRPLTGIPVLAILPSQAVRPVALVERGVLCARRDVERVRSALEQADLL